MKCDYCNKEYSKSVWKIHVVECIKNTIKMAQIDDKVIVNMDNPNMYREMSYNELRQEAKDLDLGKNPNKAELIEALELNKFGQVND